jgi:hypothetical protein
MARRQAAAYDLVHCGIDSCNPHIHGVCICRILQKMKGQPMKAQVLSQKMTMTLPTDLFKPAPLLVTAGTFSGLGSRVLNDTGLTAFGAFITGGANTPGFYLGDGRDTVAAQLQGAALAGKTVSSLNMFNSSLNRHGQVAHRATFIDGTR